MSAYNRDELFSLWKNFRGQDDEIRVLMDFALCDRDQAKALISDFEILYETQLLNLEQRGKER